MSFVQREIDRLRTIIIDQQTHPEHYAAMQALSWALEPDGVMSPYNMLTGVKPSSQTSEPNASAPPGLVITEHVPLGSLPEHGSAYEPDKNWLDAHANGEITWDSRSVDVSLPGSPFTRS